MALRVQDASFKEICMLVMPLFCSTKMAAISLADQAFSVYFHCNAMNQA